MKKLFILLLLSVFSLLSFNTYVNAQCAHTIELTDTYGDGWNGGTVSVSVNGVAVLNNITLATGFGPLNFNFTATTGQTIRVYRRAAGSWPTEMRIRVVSSTGAVIINAIQPVTGTATTGGTIGTASCAAGPSSPANDICTGATTLACGNTVIVNTSLATIDASGSGSCGTTITTPGVWYRIVGNGQQMTLSTVGLTTADTKLMVFSGTCTGLVCVGGNDDTGGGLQSTVSWNSVNGTTYFVLAAFWTGTGSFPMALSCVNSCPTPSNDLCTNAPILNLGTNNNQTHLGTGCGSTATLGTFKDVWVAFTVPCGGMNIAIDFCGSTPVHNNAYLNIFSDCSFTTFTSAANWDFISCAGGNIRLYWNNVPAGTYYYPILIDPAWETNYTLNISGTSLHIPATAPTSISVTTSGPSYTLTLQGGSVGTNGTVQWFEGSCGSTVQGTANSITVTPTTNTTYFVRYISSCNTTACISVPVDPIILPIDLIDFGAKYNSSEKNVKVEWSANVSHTDEHFVIQRSKDGVEFDSIGIIYPNEVGTNYFEFIDKSPYYNGVSYYRLKMIERDNYHFSNLSAIEVDGYNNEISLYPNPFNENIKVQNLGEYKGICSISIYDALGKLVLQKTIDFNLESKYEIDTKLLTSGFYTVEIKTDQITKSSKLRK